MSTPSDPIRIAIDLDRAALQDAIAQHLRPGSRDSGWGRASTPISGAIDEACRSVSAQVRDAVQSAVREVVSDPAFAAALRDAYREAALGRARERARVAVDRSRASLFGEEARP